MMVLWISLSCMGKLGNQGNLLILYRGKAGPVRLPNLGKDRIGGVYLVERI